LIFKAWVRKLKTQNAKTAYELAVLFNKKITAFYRSSYKGILGRVQVEVLDYLYENGEARIQDIADALNVAKQHASKIIFRLKELELVTGKTDSTDKRASLFCLTEKGRNFVHEHITSSDLNFERLLEGLETADQEKLAEAMEVMVAVLRKM